MEDTLNKRIVDLTVKDAARLYLLWIGGVVLVGAVKSYIKNSNSTKED